MEELTDPGVQVGDPILYCMEEGNNPGELRPGLVVRRWSDDPNGAVQLIVFIDGTNDLPGAGSPVLWKTSRLEGDAPGQYRRMWQNLASATLEVTADPPAEGGPFD